mmetsp:Transcript_60788/g.119173  ORF Transcript_60788/g.119173 Transcript_60788/m.119173 type:complete len:272 (+) Transcript_60788:1324-2139(+)
MVVVVGMVAVVAVVVTVVVVEVALRAVERSRERSEKVFARRPFRAFASARCQLSLQRLRGQSLENPTATTATSRSSSWSSSGSGGSVGACWLVQPADGCGNVSVLLEEQPHEAYGLALVLLQQLQVLLGIAFVFGEESAQALGGDFLVHKRAHRRWIGLFVFGLLSELPACLLQLSTVGPREPVHLLAVEVKQKGRHGAHVALPTRDAVLIHVHFQEDGFARHVSCERLVVRSDLATGSAALAVKINDDRQPGVLFVLLQVRLKFAVRANV